MNKFQEDILRHLNVSDSDRGPEWELRFFDLFPNANVSLLSQEPQQGPDGMSYMIVEISEESDEPAQRLLSWLSVKGIGLVINPQKEFPDFIFTYGMIWNFKERELFVEPLPSRSGGDSGDSLTSKDLVVGEPSEDFLPKYVRTILKQFFLEQGVYDPKFILVGDQSKNLEICFSMESLGSPKEEEHQGILEAISWFLPTHFRLAMGSQSDLPKFYSV